MKTSTVIEISWDGVTELLCLDDSVRSGEVIETREMWPDAWGGFHISYNATVVRRAKIKAFCKLDLLYKRSRQSNPCLFAGELDVRWGTWSLKWPVDGRIGTAIWIDEDPAYEVSSRKGKVKVFRWQRSTSAIRKRQMRSIGARPDQQALRRKLLMLDRVCAISGYKLGTALDVAHIIPATNLDFDAVDNAILLRADLHRLFDAHLIRLVLRGGRAYFSCSKSVRSSYEHLIEGVPLNEQIFKRIKSAVAIRQRMYFKPRSGARL